MRVLLPILLRAAITIITDSRPSFVSTTEAPRGGSVLDLRYIQRFAISLNVAHRFASHAPCIVKREPSIHGPPACSPMEDRDVCSVRRYPSYPRLDQVDRSAEMCSMHECQRQCMDVRRARYWCARSLTGKYDATWLFGDQRLLELSYDRGKSSDEAFGRLGQALVPRKIKGRHLDTAFRGAVQSAGGGHIVTLVPHLDNSSTFEALVYLHEPHTHLDEFGRVFLKIRFVWKRNSTRNFVSVRQSASLDGQCVLHCRSPHVPQSKRQKRAVQDPLLETRHTSMMRMPSTA
ncbi:hypothetical protein PSPO01_00057 [Paraphaeosphaeria sporulosa]